MRMWTICDAEAFYEQFNHDSIIYNKRQIFLRYITAFDNLFVKPDGQGNPLFPIRCMATTGYGIGLNVETYVKTFLGDLGYLANPCNLLIELEVPTNEILCIRPGYVDYGSTWWDNQNGMWIHSGYAQNVDQVIMKDYTSTLNKFDQIKNNANNACAQYDAVIPYIKEEWIVSVNGWTQYTYGTVEIRATNPLIQRVHKFPAWNGQILIGSDNNVYSLIMGEIVPVEGENPAYELRMELGCHQAPNDFTIAEALSAGCRELVVGIDKCLDRFGVISDQLNSLTMGWLYTKGANQQ